MILCIRKIIRLPGSTCVASGKKQNKKDSKNKKFEAKKQYLLKKVFRQKIQQKLPVQRETLEA